MKRSLFLTALLVIGLVANSFSQTVHPGCVDGTIYLKYKPGAVKTKIKNPNEIPFNALPGLAAIAGKYGVTKAYKPYYQATDDDNLMRVYRIDFSNKNMVATMIEELAANSLVEYAEKVPIMVTHYTPNDPMWSGTTGGIPNNWHLTKINAQNAWNVFAGTSTIVVAVVDNAIMTTHPDLSANIWTNPGEILGNSIDDDGNGWVDDGKGWDVGDNDNSVLPPNTTFSHGSHTSGIVGARTDNTVGIAAIGFNVRVMPVKATTNSGGSTSITNGYGGIVYAARSKARVISCSWGGTVSAATDQSVIDYAWNKGCIIFCSAGNDGNSVLHYPAAYNNVYSVASSGQTDVRSGFTCFGSWVDITAPGENILSTVPNTSYQQLSGTSMACPLVAGLAGLMLSKNPYMSQTQVLNCISSSATNINASNPGYAGLLGAGRIDAAAAMNCASVTAGSPPVADFYSNKQSTCPGNNISFYDASFLYPNSWSWSFQSGTPATSTSSAPVVSWAAPGTYSVALTVSNPFGSNSITKVSYITITSPGSLPLVEGFQGASWPPANWVDDNKFQDSTKWTRSSTVGGYGLSSASALFDNYYNDASGVRDELQMPKLNMSAVVAAQLKFDVAFARYDATYTDSMEVRLSTNCGNTWNSIYFKGGTALATAPDFSTAVYVPAASEWRTETVTITGLAAGQPNVLMSFVNHGHYGQALYVDNVNIAYTLTAAPAANFNYAASICAGAATTFTDASTNSPTSWSWTLPGGAPATSTLQSPNVSYAAAGVYQATLTATNGGGSNTVVKSITITANPVVSTGGTSSICSGNSATITSSGASTYTWNPGGLTGSSVVVNPSATTVYTVTGANGSCIGTANKTLTVTPTPTVSVNTASVCGGSTATLTASGAATYSWNTGAITNFITASPVSTTNYTVIGTSSGCSNQQVTSITVVSSPTVAVNSVTICNGGTANLTASGATTYSWNTGSTAATISVSPTSNTTYTITGSTGTCTDVKTAMVTVNANPTVTAVTSNSMLCVGQSATLTASGASTYTWNPGGAGTSIVISPTTTTTYSLNGTGANGCGNSNLLVQTVSTCAGVEQVSTSFSGNIYVMPNPNNGQFTINADMQDAYDVTIYNSIGQLIQFIPQNKSVISINLSDYGKGMYNVMFNVNGNYKNIKVIVE